MFDSFNNRNKLILLAVVSVLALMLYGCGVDINDDFAGFGGGMAAYHPFAQTSQHGGFLADNGYDVSGCEACHGPNLDGGGNPELSCSGSGCHNAQYGGPWACNSCHGYFFAPAYIESNWAPEASFIDPHQAHLLADEIFPAMECERCHIVPSAYDDDGHIYNDVSDGAEVIFSGLATHQSYNPEWNAENGTCSSVYCHGEATPVWQQADGSWSACGACHGIPPDDPIHNFWSESPCSNCHQSVVNADTAFIAVELHINGQIDF